MGTFDDLIPKGGVASTAPQNGGAFDDLVPGSDTYVYQKGREHWARPVVSWDEPFFGRLGETLADLGKVGAQGLTLGLSDEIAAGAQAAVGGDYEKALAARQQGLNESKARMNYGTPYSADVFEGTTSVVNPLSRMGLLGLGGVGAVSSIGHGERDPWEIAKATALGAAAGHVGNALSYAPVAFQKAVPSATKVLNSVGNRDLITPGAAVSLATMNPVPLAAAAATKYGAKAGANLLKPYGPPPTQLDLFNRARQPAVPWSGPKGAAEYPAAVGRWWMEQ